MEKAVIDAVKETLLDTDNLREKLLGMIEAVSRSALSVDVEDLKQQRERLKKRTQLIVAHLDEETLADAQDELEKLKGQRRLLDEQIAAADSAQTPKVDAEIRVERVIEEIEKFSREMDSLPNHLIRNWLAALVPIVIVDMETKSIEIHVALQPATLKTAFPGEKPMRLVTTSASSTAYETHPSTKALLAIIDCEFKKSSNHICFDCRRRAAA